MRWGRHRDWLCALVSLSLHVWFVLGPRPHDSLEANLRRQPMAASFESVSPPAPPPPSPVEPPVPVPEPPVAKLKRGRPPAPVPVAPSLATNEASEGLTVRVAEEVPADEVGSPDGTEEQGSLAAGGGDGTPVRERQVGPTQLSIWLNPLEMQPLALLRPMLTLLMAVPGYQEVFRGSSVRPFMDLQLLRVFLPGLRPESLAVAGVHTGGEKALMAAAQRVAAMRSFEVEWQGDSDLRATAWIDNSGIDRGLAIHEGAFLIGARQRMPALLGSAEPGERVAQLSKLRREVVIACSIEDTGVYLGEVARCGLQALRVSVAARSDAMRMSLRASYASSALAARAPACLSQLPVTAAEPRRLIAWLGAASAAAGSYDSQLRTIVTRDDVERLLDEISGALRRAARM